MSFSPLNVTLRRRFRVFFCSRSFHGDGIPVSRDWRKLVLLKLMATIREYGSVKSPLSLQGGLRFGRRDTRRIGVLLLDMESDTHLCHHHDEIET